MNETPHLPEGSSAHDAAERRPWVPPAVIELPKLTDLTLASDGPIDGGGGGGSTVF